MQVEWTGLHRLFITSVPLPLGGSMDPPIIIAHERPPVRPRPPSLARPDPTAQPPDASGRLRALHVRALGPEWMGAGVPGERVQWRVCR